MKKPTIFFLCWLTTLVAQAQTHPQALYWVRYQNILQLRPAWSWNNEADNRRFFAPDVAHQLIFHSRLHYKFKAWDVGAGLTYSRAYAQRPEIGYQHVSQEFRPVVELSREKIGKKFSIQHRVRLDNRFLEDQAGESVWQSSRFLLRIRYRLQLRVPLTFADEGIPRLTLKLADEIMVNDRDNVYDQNRIYASLEHALSKSLSLETGYIYIHQHRLGQAEYYQRHVLRLSLIHRVAFKSRDKR